MTTKHLPAFLVVAAGLACAPAMAEGRSWAVTQNPSGYSLEVEDEYGGTLPTYSHRGRTYVMGSQGQRYRIRVRNPTARRVEAVISVDGLDAVDGRTADYRDKRGYLIQPYGEVVIDGFRVSLDDVATFRFSSVPDSYAGRKGQARHVGVIGVAFFAEKEHEPAYIPIPEPAPWHGHDHRSRTPRAKAAPPADAPSGQSRADADVPSPPPSAPSVGGGRATAPSPGPSARSESQTLSREESKCCGDSSSYRPGLGTEFGERRHSPVSNVQFEREHPTRPTAVVELRYNDRDGLAALGIPVVRPPYPDDTYLRETASPFPGSPYATPPRGW
jgi:hypothetical protein